MKLAHISKHKRSEGYRGGVEKFASHLQQVFPEIQLFSFTEDYPKSGNLPDQDYEQARLLNSYLLDKGTLTSDMVVIADGYWSLGLEGKVKKLISIAHGTYIGTAWMNERYPFVKASMILDHAKIQGQAYREADIIVVVSQATQEELWQAFGIEAIKIINGVDLKIFHPDKNQRQKDLILHVASHGRKQLQVIEALQTRTPLRIEYLGIDGTEQEEAERWRQGMVFFQPALYEGCSYASLEAMASGCIPVAFRTGIWAEVTDDVGIIMDDHYIPEYARALQRVLEEPSGFNPRTWVEKNASIQNFMQNWKRLLQSCN